MRGNHLRPVAASGIRGSIPAHAGEPWTTEPDRGSSGVYPRACGGTALQGTGLRPQQGLSPRMRGNPPCPSATWRPWRSIPAHAGEPMRGSSSLGETTVYPRACGGTMVWPSVSGSVGGLSPRMRGNPTIAADTSLQAGSIPAHAGEPAWKISARTRARVYPRACGGTSRLASNRWDVWGLSPRMRGNRRPGRASRTGPGSIPAHAGEPRPEHRPNGFVRVYPRACGGTSREHHIDSGHQGLSPRMRGNRFHRGFAFRLGGSIPAHAGEPITAADLDSLARVYPRACGGTGWGARPGGPGRGLSPRMRGNLSRRGS